MENQVSNILLNYKMTFEFLGAKQYENMVSKSNIK